MSTKSRLSRFVRTALGGASTLAPPLTHRRGERLVNDPLHSQRQRYPETPLAPATLSQPDSHPPSTRYTKRSAASTRCQDTDNFPNSRQGRAPTTTTAVATARIPGSVSAAPPPRVRRAGEGCVSDTPSRGLRRRQIGSRSWGPRTLCTSARGCTFCTWRDLVTAWNRLESKGEGGAKRCAYGERSWGGVRGWVGGCRGPRFRPVWNPAAAFFCRFPFQ